ncbi:MAG: electron transfer flavoprotein subunit beta/FixA family protein [Candidatus Bathyarchaeia archaeon]
MKVVPKTEAVSFNSETKTLDRTKAENEINPADKNALELALHLREKHRGSLTVLSMGPPIFEPHLKMAVAMGADDAGLLSDPAFGGADTDPTSYTLAMAVRKLGNFDLVVCGEESSDASTGQVPAGIAEWLNCAQITFASEVELTSEGRLKGKRSIRGGYEVISVPLPAVVSVEFGVNTPRFPDFRRKRWADKEFKVKVLTARDLELDESLTGKRGSRTVVKELIEVRPPSRKKEFIKGDPEEKARQLMDRLAEVWA